MFQTISLALAQAPPIVRPRRLSRKVLENRSNCSLIGTENRISSSGKKSTGSTFGYAKSMCIPWPPLFGHVSIPPRVISFETLSTNPSILNFDHEDRNTIRTRTTAKEHNFCRPGSNFIHRDQHLGVENQCVFFGHLCWACRHTARHIIRSPFNEPINHLDSKFRP